MALRRLRGQARTRWDRLAEDRGRPPNGSRVLTEVSVSPEALALVRRRSARLSIFEPGSDEEPRSLALEANDDGLFDVTGLGIV